MPYIQIKCYPKDEPIKKEVAQRICDTFTELWGCSKEAISISFEQVDPSNWEQVVNEEILPNKENMYVLCGEAKK